MAPDFKIERDNISFWINVKPRAPGNRLELASNGEFRLKVQAPALEGQANEACIEFLARELRLPQSSIEIVSGKKARRKLLRIHTPSPQETARRLREVARSGSRS